MTTYTMAQLATRVLKDLGLIAAEETPSSADLAWATETAQSELLQMQARGINVWNGSVISIQQEYLSLLSRRIGLAMAPSYGLTDIATATVAMEAAELNLRRLGQVGPTYGVGQSEHF